ncbi:MAG: hypothetical protein PHW32_02570 [Bacilli bacterium]|nr:hypothetical protein [Bacilli bacterium]MDD4283106.1 hypothetical protein [Bacilli bacterium]MDD4718748.1 hypothetical protein [Bacilli bacterium]
MKIVFENDNIKVYLNKEYTNKIDINNISKLEEYLSRILFRLKNDCQIEIIGYYELKILYDELYGIVIILNKNDYEYADLFESQIDLDLNINKTNFFLYEVDDLFVIDDKLLKKAVIYIYKQKLYLKLISNIETLEMGRLLEFSNLICGDKVSKIINKGKIIFI